MDTMISKLYSTAEVAGLASIHKDTLLRWLRGGIVPEPYRDRHGWRVFSESEVANVMSVAKTPLSVREKKSQYGSNNSIKERLHSLDWDFDGAKTQYLTHSLHPYPAKFIPQIPNALIQELSSVGDTILDIFSGSGTTLVEALTLKRNAIGIDANPLAVLIGKAKTTPITSCDVDSLNQLAEKANELANQVSIPVPHLFYDLPFQSDEYRPDEKSISFWFEEFIVEELAEILSWCKSLKSLVARNLATTAFSSIVVRVSKQDSDTRYVRREKKLSSGDAFKKFSKSLSSAIYSIQELGHIIEERFYSEILCSSLLDKPQINQADLVVCSPPYPNAYSYHLYHMTRMIWLGMDQPKFKKEEIGSHRKYSSKGSNGATIETFYQEMELIFSWLSTKLKSGGYACFIVGDSTIRGEKIDNTSLLSKAAQHCDFTEITRIERVIQKTKKSFNPKIGKIKKEHILVLRNQ